MALRLGAGRGVGFLEIIVLIPPAQEDKRLVHESETLKRFWQDPNLDDNEKFLREYVH
jgi:hypothetical protein